MSEMDEILHEFLLESNELLDELDDDFLTLETNASPDLLAKIFRCMHTIKGSCGFLDLSRLEHLAHVSENLLSKLRDGHISITTETINLLVEVASEVRDALATIESTSVEGPKDFKELTTQIEAILRANAPDAAQAPATLAAVTEPVRAASAPPASSVSATPPPNIAVVPAGKLPEDLSSLKKPNDARPLGEILIAKGIADEQDVAAALSGQEAGDSRRLGEILVANRRATPAAVNEALQGQTGDRRPSLSESSIRVDVDLLDSLMNLAGELVLARNQIQQFTAEYADRGFHNSCARLNLITTELQERVMQTRMQPVGSVWSKFPRVVRQLANVCDKKIRVEMDGRDTELDKTILEAIKDPLTHFIRNAVDHGVESRAARVAAGKPEEGVISLRARQEGGQVILEIADDGAGIPVERIRKKALDKGLITQAQAARMGDTEVLNMIFLPGFSTAESVTNVSGRGVGMDVVKTNIERVGGMVTIGTAPGHGTTFQIKIPLTLAIIPALIVTSGGCRYALPQVSLLELVRLEAEESKTRIERIHGQPVYRLRGDLLPLVYLNRELELKLQDAANSAPAVTNIVVLQTGNRQFGLVVDHINDTSEIVVKPLGKQLKNISAFAGATILGDGTVALILDVVGLAQGANVASDTQGQNAKKKGAEAESKTNVDRLLLFEVGASRHMAISLTAVARLEEFEASKVEHSQGRDVIQYRGNILPLCRLTNVLGELSIAKKNTPETLTVLVHDTPDGAVGLIVDRIVDIVDDVASIQKSETDDWLIGSGIVQDQVTDFLDIERLIASQDILWLSPPRPFRATA